jgi:hypothetical protein
MTIQITTSGPLEHCLIDTGTHIDVSVAFQRLVEEQNTFSRKQLSELHGQWLGPHGVFAAFSAEVERLGRQAPVLDDLASLSSTARINEAEQAVAFALAQCNRRHAAINPFGGRSRQELCCVVFAAFEAMRQSDSDFFIKLIATTRGVTERRIVFLGLLEHYDRLLPVEKSIYPEAYREVQQTHLEREEGLYGPLVLSDSLQTLLTRMTPLELLKQIDTPTDAMACAD